MQGGAGTADHWSQQDFEAFRRGALDRLRVRAVLAHLVRGCPACAAALAPESFPPRPSPEGYEFPLRRALRAFAQRYAAERAAPAAPPAPVLEHLAKVLAPVPPLGEAAWRECEALLAESWRLRHEDPDEMLWLAQAAVPLAESIDPATRGPAALADLQARALAARGNARRVADDASGAEADLLAALERSGAGTGDRLVLAEVLERLGIVYSYQRRFADSCRFLGYAQSLYEREGRQHEAGVVLMHVSLAAMYQPAPEEAADHLLAALIRLDPEQEPKAIPFCLHNLAWTWTDCGRFAEAEALLARCRPLFAEFPDPLIQIKLLWLDARIAAGLGRYGLAERCFQRARGVFLARNLPYTAALVALDLAALWLRRGHTAPARALVLETVGTFKALRIGREAAAAIFLLGQAAQQDRLTAAILHSVAADLQKIQR